MATRVEDVVPTAGWFRQLAPLWPLAIARILYGIPNVPHEWGWTYTMPITLPVLFLFTSAGRSFGADAFLVAPLERAAERGSRLARLVRWLV